MIFVKESNIAILLMAGEGSRFSSSCPKQYFLINEKPLFFYAAKKLNLSSLIDFIVYVVPKGREEYTEELIERFDLQKEHVVIEGSSSREESTYNAIKYLSNNGVNEDSIILIQDADRPFLDEDIIQRNINGAKERGAALTMIPSTDSLAFVSEERIDNYLPRKNIFLLQTPQTFKFNVLNDAFMNAKIPLKEYTDEGSLVVERNMVKPCMVLGSKKNIKITEEVDLKSFEEK